MRINTVKATWITVFFEADPRVFIVYQAYDQDGVRMAGYGGNWERPLSALSPHHQNALRPVVDTMLAECTEIAKTVDLYYDNEDITLVKAEISAGEGGTYELNIQRYYDDESDWPGDLLIVERGEETLLNYRRQISNEHHAAMVSMMDMVQTAFTAIRLNT